MKNSFFLLISAVLIFSCIAAFAQETSIKEQSKQLSSVRKTIKQKQLEKDRLMLQEKVFKRELKSLNDAIEENRKNLAKISNEIKVAEANLGKASKEHSRAFEKQMTWNQAMLDEIELFNKMTFEISYEKDPVEYKIRQEALRYKKENFDQEEKRLSASESDIKKWKKARETLMSLIRKENRLADERKRLINEKNKLLKNTSGRRAKAEAEIKALNESAKALQTLISKITAANKQKQAQPTVIRTPVSASKRKKSLPWPLEGKVIVKFGKSKHPELDTYVISNGIKVKAPDGSRVKSIDAGIVVFAGEFRSYGKVVIIDHRDSSFSVYGQLDQILVKEDQKVLRGTVLANLGKGENSVLYFEIRQDNVPDNPLLWLQAK